MSLKRLFGLDKLENLFTIIKQNGGLLNSASTLYRTDALKKGTMVGMDEFGNRYFENNEYFIGRNRWVIFPKKEWLEYDASQIPPEWHRWMHNMTDSPPSTSPLVKKPWELPYEENQSGYAGQYMPYSTTRPKIQAWSPPPKASRK